MCSFGVAALVCFYVVPVIQHHPPPHYMPQHSNNYPWQSTSEESLTGQDCIGNTDDAGHSKVKKCVDNSSNGKGKAEADNQQV